MITKKYELKKKYPNILKNYGSKDKTVFFDIETTGLSAKTSFVYLISALYYENNKCILVQWFGEGINDESKILLNFDNLLKSKSLLIHFNGEHFDIPYVKYRMQRLNLTSELSTISSLDLYLELKQYKKLLKLENCKLKTFEKFLNLHRDDEIDGGQAINEYYKYINEGTTTSLENCLLHNKEDVLNLPAISTLFVLKDIASVNNVNFCISNTLNICKLKVELNYNFDFNYHFSFDDASLSINNNNAELLLSVNDNNVKLHYSDYKNYAFLPTEGYAVEKSYIKTLNYKASKRCNLHTSFQTILLENLVLYNQEDLSVFWNKNIQWLFEAVAQADC